MASFDQKIVNKARVWHKHGKHCKIDPHLLHVERRRRDDTKWVGSIPELFKKK